MITLSMPSLKAWGLAASLLTSHNQARLSDRVLSAMAVAALDRPVSDTDDGVKTMMALEVALAWMEGGNHDGQPPRLGPHADNDGGSSFCWAQIYLPNGQKTWDGWTGKELVEDPVKCAKAAALIIKYSVTHGPVDCPLCLYARGRVTDEARRLSGHRVDLAHKLLREIPWKQEGE